MSRADRGTVINPLVAEAAGEREDDHKRLPLESKVWLITSVILRKKMQFILSYLLFGGLIFSAALADPVPGEMLCMRSHCAEDIE